MADDPRANNPGFEQGSSCTTVAHGDVDAAAAAAAGMEDGTIHMDVDGDIDREHLHHLHQQQHDNVSTLGDEWFDLQINGSAEDHDLQVGGLLCVLMGRPVRKALGVSYVANIASSNFSV